MIVSAATRSRSRRQELRHARISSGKDTKEHRVIQCSYATLIDTLGKTVDPAHFARKSLIGDKPGGDDAIESNGTRTITDYESHSNSPELSSPAANGTSPHTNTEPWALCIATALSGETPSGSAGAPYHNRLKWEKPQLKVEFMNPIRSWRWTTHPKDFITTTDILKIANVWSSEELGLKGIIPEFVPWSEEDEGESDIRVKFKCSWSYIGTDAQSHRDEPTMVLNLSLEDDDYREYVVIHEFGHALGLNHEHQSSRLANALDKPEMIEYLQKKNNVGREKAEEIFEKDYGQFSEDSVESIARETTFDPRSIMCYLIPLKCIKESYRNRFKEEELRIMTTMSYCERKSLTKIDLDTIKELYSPAFSLQLNAAKAVVSVSDWEELGRQLGVSSEKIAQLMEDGRDSKLCREEVVQEWLRKDETASWEKLCEALKRMPMDHEAEIQTIKEQYLNVSSHPPKFQDIKAQEYLRHWGVYAGVTVLAALILSMIYAWPTNLDPKAIIEGDLRLVGGNRCEGRLQVAVVDQKSTTNSLQWSTACDKNFGTKEIKIACMQLDCPTGDPKRQSISRFGGRPRSPHDYQAFGFTCSGQESKVIDCPYTGAYCNISDRRIDDIIGISCNEGDEPTTAAPPQLPKDPAEGKLRLAGGPSPCEGRLKVYVPFLKSWAQAVYRDFGTKEAQVACRELGCGNKGERISAFNAVGPYIEVGYRCNGDEKKLKDCQAISVFSRGAEHYIGLRCSA